LSQRERIDALIDEALKIIPAFTTRWGSFNSFPESGYTERNPQEWQREVMEVLDGSLLSALKPDTNDIVQLAEVVNLWTLTPPGSLAYARPNGQEVLLPTSVLATVLGYALLEMLIRKLVPGGGKGKNSLEPLLRHFQKTTELTDLARDLKSLNSAMQYEKEGKAVDLYNRLKRGRDMLLHGNVLRTEEGEGLLLAPLIDLILLHVMKHELQSLQ
jgi:hypothetical protein